MAGAAVETVAPGGGFFGEVRGGLNDFFSFKLLNQQARADNATVAFLKDQEIRAEARSASAPGASQAGLFPGVPLNIQTLAIGLGAIASFIAIARALR